MQHQSNLRVWKKQIRGNVVLKGITNELRHFVEEELPKIDVSCYENRPKESINLSYGDPTISQSFRTHPTNLDIIAEQIGSVNNQNEGMPRNGLGEAREAIAFKYQATAYTTRKENVHLAAGGALTLWLAMMLLAEQGDNFLFPSPGYSFVLTIAKFMKITPKFYHLSSENQWQADLQEIDSLIDQKTRFIYVNDPSNPLSSCWSAQHKHDLIRLCQQRKLPILADQIYEGLTYQKPIKTFAELSENDEVTILKCSGLTKRWFGPGWRFGWLIVYSKEDQSKIYNEKLRKMTNIVGMPHQSLQYSLKQILNNQQHEKHIWSRMDILKENQKMLKKSLENQIYCSVGDAAGALYATILVDLSKFQKISCMVQFCKQIYAEQNVMIFPGQFFAADVSFVRLVICRQTEILQQFIIRFKRFCSKNLNIEKDPQ